MDPSGNAAKACAVVNIAAAQLERKLSVVCFADLPPTSSSKIRYLVRRLRSTLPELRIAVGRWAPQALADESSQTLLHADAAGLAAPPLSIGRGSA
jgi:hypothetical protein